MNEWGGKCDRRLGECDGRLGECNGRMGGCDGGLSGFYGGFGKVDHLGDWGSLGGSVWMSSCKCQPYLNFWDSEGSYVWVLSGWGNEDWNGSSLRRNSSGGSGDGRWRDRSRGSSLGSLLLLLLYDGLIFPGKVSSNSAVEVITQALHICGFWGICGKDDWVWG